MAKWCGLQRGKRDLVCGLSKKLFEAAPFSSMRVESAELSAHVSERGDGIALSPIVAAAEAFVQASLLAQAAES
jgi:hypothetical protein